MAGEQDPPVPSRIEVEGRDGIAIRQLVAEDAPRYFDLVNASRPHLSQIHSGERDVTAGNYETVEDVLESIVDPKDPSKYRFGIWDGDNMVGSNNIRLLPDGRAVVGSWIAKEYTGHNYAARARKLLVDVGFNHFGVKELVSEILVGNLASRKSVERSGFSYTGTDGNKWILVMPRPIKEHLA